MSWPDTLADDPEVLAACRLKPDAPDLPTATVRAPCCGRTCAADMVVDMRGVDGWPADWSCDGCRWREIRGPSAWTKAKMVRALGAPVEDVRTERVKELVREAERAARDRGDSFISPDARRAARRSLSDVGMPAGTQPPS